MTLWAASASMPPQDSGRPCGPEPAFARSGPLAMGFLPKNPLPFCPIPPQPPKEPCVRKRGEPRRLRRLTFCALAEGAVSEAKATEWFGLSVRELDRWMKEPPLTKPEATSKR